MSKSKILFVGPLPPPYSGPEISAELFINSKVKDEFNLFILNTNFRKSNSEKGKIGISLIKAFFWLNHKLLNQLIFNKPKIIYYYVTATMLGWIGKDIWVIMLSKLFRVKVVIHMRAGHFRSNYNKANLINRLIIKFVLNLTNYNLAQSESLAKQYELIVKDKKKIGFVYNMINLSNININNNYNENIIIFIGHLSHAKGYCDIIQIIPKVAAKFPNVQFCFAGTVISEERNVLRNSIDDSLIVLKNPIELYNEIIKDKYDQNYRYLGSITGTLKNDWISKCNFMVLPSYSEGFSMSVLEGIAFGKPIITTPVGALKDIIEHGKNGLLLLPGEKDKLESHILELLSNKKLRNEIAFNNRIKRNDFSVENIENNYIKLFKRFL